MVAAWTGADLWDGLCNRAGGSCRKAYREDAECRQKGEAGRHGHATSSVYSEIGRREALTFGGSQLLRPSAIASLPHMRMLDGKQKDNRIMRSLADYFVYA